MNISELWNSIDNLIFLRKKNKKNLTRCWITWSAFCTLNTQSVCNEACQYTNKHLLYFMNFFRSSSLWVTVSSYVMCLYICLTDWKMDTSIHYLHILTKNNPYIKLALLNHCRAGSINRYKDCCLQVYTSLL